MKQRKIMRRAALADGLVAQREKRKKTAAGEANRANESLRISQTDASRERTPDFIKSLANAAAP